MDFDTESRHGIGMPVDCKHAVAPDFHHKFAETTNQSRVLDTKDLCQPDLSFLSGCHLSFALELGHHSSLLISAVIINRQFDQDISCQSQPVVLFGLSASFPPGFRFSHGRPGLTHQQSKDHWQCQDSPTASPSPLRIHAGASSLNL